MNRTKVLFIGHQICHSCIPGIGACAHVALCDSPIFQIRFGELSQIPHIVHVHILYAVCILSGHHAAAAQMGSGTGQRGESGAVQVYREIPGGDSSGYPQQRNLCGGSEAGVCVCCSVQRAAHHAIWNVYEVLFQAETVRDHGPHVLPVCVL